MVDGGPTVIGIFKLYGVGQANNHPNQIVGKHAKERFLGLCLGCEQREHKQQPTKLWAVMGIIVGETNNDRDNDMVDMVIDRRGWSSHWLVVSMIVIIVVA